MKFINDFLLQENTWYMTEELHDDINCLEVDEITPYIRKLHKIIKKQRKLLNEFFKKIHNYQNGILSVDVSTQTDTVCAEVSNDINWKKENTSVEEMVKEAAENAIQQSGFVYEATSGLYYDYKTGYYYNAEFGLYYDGNNGTYYSYDKDNNTFIFHSQISTQQKTESSDEQYSVSEKQNIKKKKRNIRSSDDSMHDSLIKPNEAKNKSTEDIEEGECSDCSSSFSDSTYDHTCSATKKFKYDDFETDTELDESASAWPPCMRIIVKETSAENINTGKLFIVTRDGGTLGREGKHCILISDINISKYHAKLSFDTIDEKKKLGNYILTDLGSRNGTYINNERISAAFQESDPCVISHDSTIRVGGTSLLCHIHNGNETCSECEPGLLTENHDKKAVYTTEEKLSEKRKKQLKLLKNKFAVHDNPEQKATSSNKDYVDRAEIRRKTVGSSFDGFKTEVASVDQPIKRTNKGFKMLEKMGWTEGDTLGTTVEAIKEPITIDQRPDKMGLGFDGITISVPETLKKKQDIWKKTQDRYSELK